MIQELRASLRKFNEERDWNQFHTPKNLACGLVVEAAELLEIFTWLETGDAPELSGDQLARVREEIGDVQLYLLNLCERLGLEPLECASQKLEANARKYPADRVRGSARKYSEY